MKKKEQNRLAVIQRINCCPNSKACCCSENTFKPRICKKSG